MDRGKNYCSKVQLVRRWAQSGFRFNASIELWLVRNRAEPEISLVVTPVQNNQPLVGRSSSEHHFPDPYRRQTASCSYSLRSMALTSILPSLEANRSMTVDIDKMKSPPMLI